MQHRRVFHRIIHLFFTLVLTIINQPAFAKTNIIQVSTTVELKEALRTVQPGQTIQMADGVYSGNFAIQRSGQPTAPIYLQGSAQAILDGGSLQDGYVLHLAVVDYWVLNGFTLRNAAKGVMLDQARHNVLNHLQIQDVGAEAVHFRTCSTDNTLQSSTIQNTGVITPSFGEGVYIGSDADQWGLYSCDPDSRDKSHNNAVVYNVFGPNVRAEAIDAKEGTLNGKIVGNCFEATGLSGENYANSWVDIKGNRYLVAQNRARRGNTPALLNGFEVHAKVIGWGRNNLFAANVVHIDGDGYGFYIDTQDANAGGNLVYTDNQVLAASKGIANIPLTQAPATLLDYAFLNQFMFLSPAHQFTATATIWLPLITKPPYACS